MVDDAELLRRYAEEKSEAAFAEVVSRHLDLVYSAALRRLGGDAGAATDVTQQVFIALARRAKGLARGVVLPAWLYATTRNIAVDFVRAERRRRAREQKAHTMNKLASNPPSAAETADWEQLRPMLDEMMDELRDGDREVVLLRFFARRPFAEIGAALDVSEDAARMRVERALGKLRALLARRGVTSTSGALGLMLASEAAVAAPAGMAASVTGSALAMMASRVVIAPALNFLSFVTSTKFVWGFFGMIGLVAVGTAVRQVHARSESEAALAAAAREFAALTATLRSAEERAQAAEQDAARLRAREVEARAALAARRAAKPIPEAAAPPPDHVREGRAYLARHPAVKQAIINWYAGPTSLVNGGPTGNSSSSRRREACQRTRSRNG